MELSKKEKEDVNKILMKECIGSDVVNFEYLDYDKEDDKILLVGKVPNYKRQKIKEYKNFFLHLDNTGKIWLKRKTKFLPGVFY